jgi:hypothetical protein
VAPLLVNAVDVGRARIDSLLVGLSNIVACVAGGYAESPKVVRREDGESLWDLRCRDEHWSRAKVTVGHIF